MVRDAWYFILPLSLAAAAAAYAGLYWPAGGVLGVAIFVAWFFRDPERSIPADPGVIVSPADGKIVRISAQEDETAISIFLSIFDVHVNRAPISGRVAAQEYRPGKFLLAFDDRASVENEQLRIKLAGENEVRFTLIAGLLARRIVPWIREGDHLNMGDRIGLIRFGSRVDVFLPSRCRVAVENGDRVRGGSTILAHWEDPA